MNNKQREIWDEKAKTFERFKQNNSDTLEILNFFKEFGVNFNNKSIIDIGCGNGRFALELANSANSVLCLDISKNMLDDLHSDRLSLGLKNISIKCADFDESYKDLGAFDIVFGAMTPALNNEKSFLNALNLGREYFCYVGWGRYRQDGLTQEVLEAHGANLILPKGLPDALKWLENAGKSPITYKYFKRNFTKMLSLDDAINRTKIQCKMSLASVDEKLCAKIISKYADTNKMVKLTHSREIGAMIISK